MSESNVPRREGTEGNVPRRENTETTQQCFPQQCVVLVVGAYLLGFSSALAAVALGRKWCPHG
jgi:hypothetical protein